MTDMADMTGVTLKNLAVGYDGVPLIRDMSLEIFPGEIVTLIGPNGAGKSTILKSLSRQLELVRGTVYIGKRELASFSYEESAKKMAVVLTDRMRPELMTCRDIVSTGRYPYTGRLGLLRAEDEQKVQEAMEALQIADIAERAFETISDGQRQRVLLARAICQEPEIILLDEPTSFLDVRHKLSLLSFLRSLAKSKGITVLMSLHEIDLAEKISDRILCVKGETIFRFGTPAECFREETIRELYDIDNGFFDPLFGSLELPGIAGEPEVFVISGGGSGIPVYRALQKKQVPFAAGILFRNDVDFRLAERLAVKTLSAEPFCPIPEETIEEGLRLVRKLPRVLFAEVPIGVTNAGLKVLKEEAGKLGKLQTVSGDI